MPLYHTLKPFDFSMGGKRVSQRIPAGITMDIPDNQVELLLRDGYVAAPAGEVVVNPATVRVVDADALPAVGPALRPDISALEVPGPRRR